MPTATSTTRIANLPFAEPGTPDLRSGERFMLWVVRLQSRPLILGILCGIAWMSLQAAIPLVLGFGIQATVDRSSSGVLWAAAGVLALGIGQATAGVIRHRFAVILWLSSASRCQQLVARHVATLGADIPRQIATGEVVAVSANDVERIARVMDVLPRFIGALVAFFGVSIVLVFLSPLLGVIVLVGMPLLMAVITPLVKPLENRESTQREKYGEASAMAADTVSGLRVLRGIGGEQHFIQRFRLRSQSVRASAVRTARIRALLDALQVALPGLFVVIVTFLGARLALDGQLNVGELVAFYGLTAFLVMPLQTVTEMADKFTRGRVSARRVVNLLSLPARRAQLGSLARSGDLVDEVSGLTITEGTLCAVVCSDPNTAGELADRLGGMAAAGSRGVSIAGTPVDELSAESMHDVVIVQDKDPTILSGTLEALVDIPRMGSVERDAAMYAASAEDILEGIDWDEELPERGRSLSGGQRQRLALARSLIADPPILILDEPTSAVDAHTEARIASRLREVRRGKTTIVFTTSPLMLDQMDEVHFAPDGVVLASASHAELVRANSDYRYVVTREE